MNRIKLMHLILDNVDKMHFARNFAAIFQICDCENNRL